ncbi:T6SS phospholipase effector Tle1-like catalytic domain-containing protein [Pseudoalteromonas denitrificans]|nr:DUF2235 domain-containing protein [Pseudoalteromonas denitrificans]
MNKFIFCFDGTCNEPSDSMDYAVDLSISNILKLHAYFGGSLTNTPHNDEYGQRSFYYSGVGTYGNWLQKTFNSLFSHAFSDIKSIISKAKRDLEHHYQEGDEIFIFGFSRGAAIARIFASQIKNQVKFLGVFDTIASIDSPDLKRETPAASDVVFKNATLAKNIQKAVHILALDEKRIAFQPTLFNQDSRVLEVWFAGVHSDIGGGYWYDGLSDISLEFMCLHARQQGLNILNLEEIDFNRLKQNDSFLCFDDLEIQPIPEGLMHQQQRTRIIADRTLAPRVVNVNQDEHATDKYTAKIHHTVALRFKKVTNYRPHSLRNTYYQIMADNGRLSKVKCGITGLKGV